MIKIDKELNTTPDATMFAVAIEAIARHPAGYVLTEYPVVDVDGVGLSQHHAQINTAIELVLRRYRHRVFQWQWSTTPVIDDSKSHTVNTLWIAVDTIGHGNLDRVLPRIATVFQPTISAKIDSLEKQDDLRGLIRLIQMPLSLSTGVAHSLARYPTEIRSIWFQEQRLQQTLTYDI
jgi:hypothetical protein